MKSGICVLAALGLWTAAAPAADYDRYGGWTGLEGRKTGFFHTEQIAGRWWLVTPEGHAFFSTPVIDIAIAASVQRDLWLKGGVVDYFSPEFEQAADRAAARQCAPHAGDPWLLGYFTDNELRWGSDWRAKDSLLEAYLKMPPSSPGHRKALGFLKKRGSDAAALTDADKSAFLELVAAEYSRVTSTAIHRHDPHHMVLGCRFATYAGDSVMRGVGRYFDVISFHSYTAAAPIDRLERIHDLTGKPTMITEFSFKAMDSGLPNTKGAAKPVGTQQDRAAGFTTYVEALAALPSCVGFHWFEYRDEPKEGRFDGENSNYGVVKIDFTPWETLTREMSQVNAALESLHARSEPRRP